MDHRNSMSRSVVSGAVQMPDSRLADESVFEEESLKVIRYREDVMFIARGREHDITWADGILDSLGHDDRVTLVDEPVLIAVVKVTVEAIASRDLENADCGQGTCSGGGLHGHVRAAYPNYWHFGPFVGWMGARNDPGGYGDPPATGSSRSRHGFMSRPGDPRGQRERTESHRRLLRNSPLLGIEP